MGRSRGQNCLNPGLTVKKFRCPCQFKVLLSRIILASLLPLFGSSKTSSQTRSLFRTPLPPQAAFTPSNVGGTREGVVQGQGPFCRRLALVPDMEERQAAALGEYLLGSGTGQACGSDQPREMPAGGYTVRVSGCMMGDDGSLCHRALCRLNETICKA